jgi:hypothetical protein
MYNKYSGNCIGEKRKVTKYKIFMVLQQVIDLFRLGGSKSRKHVG